jgi:PTS system mannose-specific IIB component
VIALIRVDNRLLHGQILETWVPLLKVRFIVVADDEAAGSPLARAAMTLALPPDLPASIQPLGAVDWVALAAGKTRTLVLLRDLPDLERAVAGGLGPAQAPRINLGNVHFTQGRLAVTPSVFLSAAEVETLQRLARAGFEVEARAIPSDAPVSAEEMARRYKKGPASG